MITNSAERPNPGVGDRVVVTYLDGPRGDVVRNRVGRLAVLNERRVVIESGPSWSMSIHRSRVRRIRHADNVTPIRKGTAT